MPSGGYRENAGRKPGPTGPQTEYESMQVFERRAVLGLRHRVPDGTPQALADLADHAMMRLVDAMNEKIDPDHAPIVLKAVTAIRDEICGPVVKKIEVKMGLAQLLAQAAIDVDELPDVDVTPILPEGSDEVLGRDPDARHEKAPALAGRGSDGDGD